MHREVYLNPQCNSKSSQAESKDKYGRGYTVRAKQAWLGSCLIKTGLKSVELQRQSGCRERASNRGTQGPEDCSVWSGSR